MSENADAVARKFAKWLQLKRTTPTISFNRKLLQAPDIHNPECTLNLLNYLDCDPFGSNFKLNRVDEEKKPMLDIYERPFELLPSDLLQSWSYAEVSAAQRAAWESTNQHHHHQHQHNSSSKK